MFPRQPQQQFRTAGADVQTFYKNSNWTKPPGVSHVYMMLIGGGGDGDGTTAGGSGAVTVWYGAAQHIPDNLLVTVSTGNASNTTVNYRSSSAVVALLTATGGVLSVAGTAMAANQFAASGFFQSVAGQAGSAVAQTASATTFLSGGADNSTDSVTANYGYFIPGNGSGFFQMQPIIVSAGSSGAKTGAIGSGAGGVGTGGPGMALIASW